MRKSNKNRDRSGISQNYRLPGLIYRRDSLRPQDPTTRPEPSSRFWRIARIRKRPKRIEPRFIPGNQSSQFIYIHRMLGLFSSLFQTGSHLRFRAFTAPQIKSLTGFMGPGGRDFRRHGKSWSHFLFRLRRENYDERVNISSAATKKRISGKMTNYSDFLPLNLNPAPVTGATVAGSYVTPSR